LFYQVAAINGFDSYGHYLRAQLIVNTCTTYRVQNDPSCTANFVKGSTARAASSRDDSIRSPRLVREDRVLAGESVDQVLGRTGSPRAIPPARCWTICSEAAADAPSWLGIDRGQPGADRRGDDARRHRRRVPGLQRQQRPAVRAVLFAEGGRAERGSARQGQR